MLLSDNVSCVLQVPTIKTLSSLKEVKDPSFLFDVKLHFRQRPDHWKVSLYLRKYPDVEEAFQAFSKAMKGYVLTYGEGLIRRALIRLA